MALSTRGRIVVATAGIIVVAAGAFLTWRLLRRSPPPAVAAKPPEIPNDPRRFVTEPQQFPYKLDPRPRPGFPLRPMDIAIFEFLAKGGEFQRDQLKDLFHDRPYKVKLVYSPVEHQIKIVAIDLDRDKGVDEVWELGAGAVKRKLLHQSLPSTPAYYTLSGGRWLPH